MNINFILIQLLGFIAWLFLALSYYRKNTNRILVFQIIGTGSQLSEFHALI